MHASVLLLLCVLVYAPFLSGEDGHAGEMLQRGITSQRDAMIFITPRDDDTNLIENDNFKRIDVDHASGRMMTEASGSMYGSGWAGF